MVQLGWYSWGGTAGVVQLGWYSWGGTAGMVQLGWYSWDGTAGVVHVQYNNDFIIKTFSFENHLNRAPFSFSSFNLLKSESIIKDLCLMCLETSFCYHSVL